MSIINNFPIQTADIGSISAQIKTAINIGGPDDFIPYANIAYVADPTITISLTPEIGNPYKPFQSIRDAIDGLINIDNKHIVLLNMPGSTFVYNALDDDTQSYTSIRIEAITGSANVELVLPTDFQGVDVHLNLRNNKTIYLDYYKNVPFNIIQSGQHNINLVGFLGFSTPPENTYYLDGHNWSFTDVSNININMNDISSVAPSNATLNIKCINSGSLTSNIQVTTMTAEIDPVPGFMFVHIYLINSIFDVIDATNSFIEASNGSLDMSRSNLVSYTNFTPNDVGGNTISFPDPF